MLTVLGGLAEFERELIRARTGEGRERAKARGVHMGRPPMLTAQRSGCMPMVKEFARKSFSLFRLNFSALSALSRAARRDLVRPFPLASTSRPQAP
jgi:DNA invertase Pin-like site-specific DNA recombinase